MNLIIRAPTADDKPRWQALFDGYQKFYRASVPAATVDNTWRRILDPDSEVNALVAETQSGLVGITHYLYHRSTWNDRPTCYLEDLYVDPAMRGSGAARKLIEGVEKAAVANNAFRLYLHTQQYNSAARSLYDTIMPPSSFMVYRKSL